MATFSSDIVLYFIFCIYFICMQLVGTCCKLPCVDIIIIIIIIIIIAIIIIIINFKFEEFNKK